jgi:hypothetical protein
MGHLIPISIGLGGWRDCLITRNDEIYTIVSADEKKVAERMKSLEREKANEGITDAVIMSIVKKYTDGSSAKISDVSRCTPCRWQRPLERVTMAREATSADASASHTKSSKRYASSMPRPTQGNPRTGSVVPAAACSCLS